MEGSKRREVRNSVLKTIDSGKSPSHEEFSLSKQEFVKILSETQEDGYITGLQSTKDGLVGSPRLTPMGERYIDEKP
ncbi:YjcQ family protein [Halobacillus litoralis]|uniref:Uncharacterized protein n=1 Tax=Halobacillus litoralis TaxID=45668 RepID=A0A410MDM3_9BACI|nr:YjcQ family protein [Halobacillus litoralis]QAS52793.1 hypothetical protein HLI_11600 [Halobacillus litoralis]